MRALRTLDPVTQAVFRHRLEAIAEEMGETLRRTASSPNIKERRDYSCALFDPHGELVAQAAHIPVHLGSMPMSVRSAIDAVPLAPGDVVILNDPFAGGTHLPDVTMVTPVDGQSGRVGYVATRAHHMDVGGMSPGSMPLAVDSFQEGLAIPPVRLVRRGLWNEDLLTVLARNVRTPDEFRADIRAQSAAQMTGAARLEELERREGAELLRLAMQGLIEYSERAMRRAIRALPPGRYCAEDVLESIVGAGDAIKIRVTVEITDDGAVIDFAGTDAQVPEPLNAVLPITMSAVVYCFLCLLDLDVPTNAGCFVPLTVRAEAGSIVNSSPPAAVSAGNVETSQRIVDVVFRALAEAVPDRIPAAGQGTMNNVTFGGWDPRRERAFAYYETIGGGMGASPTRDGLSGVHVAMSNTFNTPIEALEWELPVQITHYGLRRGTGGSGRHRGGDGIERGYRFLVSVRGSVISERRSVAPWGLRGGGRGETGANTLNGERLPGKAEFVAEPGAVLTVMTPGGGGWGIPKSVSEDSHGPRDFVGAED